MIDRIKKWPDKTAYPTAYHWHYKLKSTEKNAAEAAFFQTFLWHIILRDTDTEKASTDTPSANKIISKTVIAKCYQTIYRNFQTAVIKPLSVHATGFQPDQIQLKPVNP